MYPTKAFLPSLVTETSSKGVGAVAPLKSDPAHGRVLWARWVPLISSQDPGAKVGPPPKSPAEFTDVTTGCGTVQTGGRIALSVKCTAGRPLPTAVAVTVTFPAAVPKVTPNMAEPLLSVRALVAPSVAEPDVTAKFTVTPATPNPARPLSCTFSGLGRTRPVWAVWLLPSAIVNVVGEFKINFQIALSMASTA